MSQSDPSAIVHQGREERILFILFSLSHISSLSQIVIARSQEETCSFATICNDVGMGGVFSLGLFWFLNDSSGFCLSRHSHHVSFCHTEWCLLPVWVWNGTREDVVHVDNSVDSVSASSTCHAALLMRFCLCLFHDQSLVSFSCSHCNYVLSRSSIR